MYPELFSVGPVTIYSYGVLLAASYLLGLWLAMRRAKRWGLDANRVLDLGIYIIIAALVGAKALLFIVDFDTFRQSPGELLSLARAGGVFYGGLVLAVRDEQHGLAVLVLGAGLRPGLVPRRIVAVVPPELPAGLHVVEHGSEDSDGKARER